MSLRAADARPLMRSVRRTGKTVATTQTIQFHGGGLFYRMVTSYMATICGLLVFRPELQFDQTVKVGLASTEYPALEVIPQEVKGMVANGGFSLGDVSDSLAFMLLNAAYEATVDRYYDCKWLALRQQHPELEFFRHLRNAASHGGTWSFRGDEPARPASWRGRQLTAGLQGKRVFDANLKPGDFMVLLSDIEKLLPEDDA